MITLDNVKYYSTKELSQMLNLHIKTVQAMIRDGRLKAIKVTKSYYVSEDDLRNYLKRDLA